MSVSVNKRGSAVDLADQDISVSAPLKIHEKTIEDVIAEFQSDGEKGLSPEEAAKRLEEDGPNELEKPPRISLFMLFIIQLNSVIMYLLIAAVVASAARRRAGVAESFVTAGVTVGVAVGAAVVPGSSPFRDAPRSFRGPRSFHRRHRASSRA